MTMGRVEAAPLRQWGGSSPPHGLMKKPRQRTRSELRSDRDLYAFGAAHDPPEKPSRDQALSHVAIEISGVIAGIVDHILIVGGVLLGIVVLIPIVVGILLGVLSGVCVAPTAAVTADIADAGVTGELAAA